ncbi:thyrotropin-releasing hormone receptor-like [Amphiura filiformis]|uniref:thyrotropin-releasing hormone receptor-like n=1 Tax=Amphiura filiformis TaxID=82378 RepID=UPI003B223CDF
MSYPSTFPSDCRPEFSNNLTTYIWYAYSWMFTRSEIQTFTFGLPIVLIIGTLSNGAFLFVVFKIERLHTITNLYLATLAFVDVTFVVSSAGSYLYAFTVSPVRHDAPYDSFIGCTLIFGITLAVYFTSIGLVTLVTLERYYGICLPFQHRVIASKSRTRKLIASTCLIGLVLGAIESLKFSKLDKWCVIWPHLPDFQGWPQKVGFCVPLHENVVLLGEFVDTVPFFVALIWNGYMYARIMYSLSHREVIQKESENDSMGQLQVQATKVRKQVARLLIINGMLFFFCQIWVRFNAINNILSNITGSGFYKNAETSGLMLVFGRCMLYVNSSLNPVIYNLASSFYRDAFKEAFFGNLFNREKATTLAVGSSSKETDVLSDKQINTNI